MPQSAQALKNAGADDIMASFRSTSVAPQASVGKISSAAVSKLSDANCNMRSAGSRANAARATWA